MENKRPHWAVLALVVFIVLVLAALLLPPLAKSKARSRKTPAVNSISGFSAISSFSISLPSTNARPAATSNSNLEIEPR
jgi:hypothetical protein